MDELPPHHPRDHAFMLLDLMPTLQVKPGVDLGLVTAQVGAQYLCCGNCVEELIASIVASSRDTAAYIAVVSHIAMNLAPEMAPAGRRSEEINSLLDTRASHGDDAYFDAFTHMTSAQRSSLVHAAALVLFMVLLKTEDDRLRAIAGNLSPEHGDDQAR